MVQIMNSSLPEQSRAAIVSSPLRTAHPQRSTADRFEDAYQRCLAALRRARSPDLSDDDLGVLRQVAAGGPSGVALTWLARHLARPKSTTSVAVKQLEARGLLQRTRRRDDERQLAIALTPEGRQRIDADRLLDPVRLGTALRGLLRDERDALLDTLERLADAAEGLPPLGSE